MSKHYAYRVARFEAVTVLPLSTLQKYTKSSNSKAVMDKERFKAVETARVVSLSGLKTLSFPLTEFFL